MPVPWAMPGACRGRRGGGLSRAAGAFRYPGAEGVGDHRDRDRLLAMSGGWNPTIHLTCHMNGRPRWDEDLAAFVPMAGAVPGLVAVGAANGSMSTHGALATGQAAAVKMVEALGRKVSVRCPGRGCALSAEGALGGRGQGAGLARLRQ